MWKFVHLVLSLCFIQACQGLVSRSKRFLPPFGGPSYPIPGPGPVPGPVPMPAPMPFPMPMNLLRFVPIRQPCEHEDHYKDDYKEKDNYNQMQYGNYDNYGKKEGSVDRKYAGNNKMKRVQNRRRKQQKKYNDYSNDSYKKEKYNDDNDDTKYNQNESKTEENTNSYKSYESYKYENDY